MASEGGDYIDVPLPKAGDFTSSTAEQYNLFSQHVRRATLKNNTLEDDNKQRKDYYAKSHSIIQAWIGFLIVLIFCQLLLKPIGISLGREEFIAVVVSLSGSIFGFWLLVGRYLFEPRNKSQTRKSKATRGGRSS